MNYYKQISTIILIYITLFQSSVTTFSFAQSDSTDFGKSPIIVEAESAVSGSNLLTQEDGDVTYITTKSNYTGQDHPMDASCVARYTVEFEDAGSYNLFVRVRVGPGSFDDDSFFYGIGFGEKNVNVGADWHLVNGLATAGFTDHDTYVDGPGSAGTNVWKWINITKNAYQSSAGLPFSVSADNLSQTFQIGSRENGLDFDKIAFGRADLYYTVNDLDNGLPGSTTMDDSTYVYPGPPLAEGQTKFLGCSWSSNIDLNFANYWNQLTPGNMGKWESVGRTSDTSQWNWSSLDFAYNYAKDNNLLFKNHTLIWGEQQPDWINGLDSTEQIYYIETWIRMVGERYPDMDMIDVVNEPLPDHNPPDGVVGSANYKDALGGDGTTGWDWVIKSFELARQYMPNTDLILNDYSIINSNSNTSTFLQIINLLKDRGLIDGIGVQGHRFEFENTLTNTLKYNLDRLADTGLPIYISEMDLGNIGNTGTPDDEQQLQLYEKIFPILWEHPGVKGITLWGYREGSMWQETCFLIRYNGTWRPAMDWLAQYLQEYLTDVSETEYSLPAEYSLGQNYPNPFNPTTHIQYSIANTTKVTLKVFDVLGREIQELVNEVKLPGHHTATFDGQKLSSGIYFYSLQAGSFSETKKLILLK